MDIKRRLSEGIASWILYEYHSFCGNLLEEKYLVAPIYSILTGIYKNQVVSEFNHPILEAYRAEPGQADRHKLILL